MPEKMSDTYEQYLKALARSFKNLNIQLLGFLLLGIGFIFTSDVIMTNSELSNVTLGLSAAFIMWCVSLLVFFSVEHRLEKKYKPHLGRYPSLQFGSLFFALGFLFLIYSITFLTTYIAYAWQLQELFSRGSSKIVSYIAAFAILLVYWFAIKIPPPPTESENTTQAE